MAQTRIRWIDIAKAIAIICMIVGNIVPWGSSVRNFVFSFDVPLLLVLMGFTAEEAKSLPELWRQIKKDFWKFMVPYIAFHVAVESIRDMTFILQIGWQKIWVLRRIMFRQRQRTGLSTCRLAK